jgi:predicted nucleic acid-binding protein
MIYFDTAYILKCYVHESGSLPVRQLLADHRGAACCAIGRLEFASAIRRAVRENRLDERVVSTVFAVLEQDDENGVWSWIPLTPHLLDTATRTVRDLPSDVFVRTADALHIVCAKENGFQEFTRTISTLLLLRRISACEQRM